MANYTETVQKQFDTSVRAVLDTFRASDIASITEKQELDGADETTFNRRLAGTTGTGEDPPSMLAGANTDMAGEYFTVKASPMKVWTQQKVSDTKIKKTKIDIKNDTVTGMANDLNLAIDAKIVAALLAKSDIPIIGSATTVPTDLATAKLALAEARRVAVKSKMTPDGVKDAVWVMNEEDYIAFSTNDAFINGDYEGAFVGDGTAAAPIRFKTMQIVLSNALASGDSFMIPSNTIGTVRYKNSLENTATYHPTDGQRWHMQIVDSIGVAIIEPKHITRFKFKPTTNVIRKTTAPTSAIPTP